MSSGLILSAPASGGGKTTITLGLLRALRRRGEKVRSAKSGPDYIDPRFHAAASGAECVNLDAWAMTPARIRALSAGAGTLLIEGAMGLFDGAPPDGKGATADLARILKLPVVLIVDAAKQAQSVAAVVQGFANHAADVDIVAVILNQTGSPRHEAILRRALAPFGHPVLGAIPRQAALHQPSRHLGLVQAGEHPDLETYLDGVADVVADHVDLEALLSLTRPLPSTSPSSALKPPAQRIAIARDEAFAFTYPHLLDGWRAAGAEISFFSPLADEAPQQCDFIYLPGGYPELHAGKLASAEKFRAAMRSAAEVTPIYGECGGYMTLGDGLIDAKGTRHEMLGLLRLETSFAERKLHLGYRRLSPLGGPWNQALNGHEFHYATTLKADGAPLFRMRNAEGDALPDAGLINGHISGSFAHVIEGAD